jgi:SET domain-containing protein
MPVGEILTRPERRTRYGLTWVTGDRDRGNEMALRHSDAVEVRRVRGKGRGVLARRRIRRRAVIERVPVLVLAVEEVRDAQGWSGLAGYCFPWGEGRLALALGYGSLYNHSDRPNARYHDEGGRTNVFTAIRDIGPGEEITVNYNGDPGDETPVGFEVVECLNVSKRRRSVPAGG